MFSILIKDTTREEREKIILDSIDDHDITCGEGSIYKIYLPYINGEKELREINEERSGKYCTSDKNDPYHNGGCSL